MRAVVAMALVLGAARVRAQEPDVALCVEGIPDGLVPEMRLELVARGHRVDLACEGGAWVVGVEDATLAEVWVWARSADGTRRRTRVPRSMDVVEGRALGIAAATLMLQMQREADTPRESDVDPNELEAVEPAVREEDPAEEELPTEDEVEAERELVRSSRALTPDTVVMLAAAGAVGRLEQRHGGAGGLFGVGRHVAATARIDAGVTLLGAPGLALLGVFVGLTRVWKLAPKQWFELGGALHYAQEIRVDGGGPRIGVGAGTHLGMQQGLTDRLRFYWRLSGAPLILLRETPRVGGQGVLAVGVTVAP